MSNPVPPWGLHTTGHPQIRKARFVLQGPANARIRTGLFEAYDMEQHWWFSGKIGRCHLHGSSDLNKMSASPGFDSRPMHPFAFLAHCHPFGTWSVKMVRCCWVCFGIMFVARKGLASFFGLVVGMFCWAERLPDLEWRRLSSSSSGRNCGVVYNKLIFHI